MNPTIERIKARCITTASGCWEWQGARTPFGYGRISYRNHVERTHRVVAHLTLGLTLGDRDVVAMHVCDNPPCCNPAHIRLGTSADNSADMKVKGRAKNAFTDADVCPRGHRYGEPGKSGYRRCKECRQVRERERNRARYASDPVYAEHRRELNRQQRRRDAQAVIAYWQGEAP